MGVDVKPDHDSAGGDDRLPTRDRPPGAAAARVRMLDRIVAGGVVPATPTDPETIGPYRLVRRLGRGGMGEVWEAVREGEAEPVAIKVLRAEALAHEPTRRRFLREARTAASVRHERIVRIFDVGSAEAGTPFIVMQLLQGEPLEVVVREHGALPWTAAREILLQVADGLAFAHSRGVIHRDLKPANVMVAGGLEAPQCTIIDFGLARREIITSGSESLSRTGEVFGSPPFMSPEQFRGDAADARSDVYSYGCLMFYLLTGRRPFEGEKLGELMYAHLFQPAPAPTGLRCPERLSSALVSITLRALRKAPEHRFATIADLARVLRRIDDDPRPVEVPTEDPIAPAPSRPDAPPPARRALPWVVAGVAAAVGIVATVRSSPGPSDPSSPEPRRQGTIAGEEPLGEVVAPAAAAPAAAAPASVPPAAAASPTDAVHVEASPAEGSTSADRDRPAATSDAATPRARAAKTRPKSSPPRAPAIGTPSPPPSEPSPGVSELPPNPFRSPLPNVEPDAP